MFRIPQTEEEWLEANATTILERDSTFQRIRVEHPLVARFMAAFCRYFDSGFVAFRRGDDQEAERCGAAMKELNSWDTDVLQNPNETPQEAFKRLFREGYRLDVIIDYIVSPKKKGRGRPVSNRLQVLLAYEESFKNPELSWMQLAIKYCPCCKGTHDRKCRENLRQQARLLERVISRWGV